MSTFTLLNEPGLNERDLNARAHNVLALALLIALSSVSLGCVGFLGPQTLPPQHTGPHPVGVTTIEVDDAARDRHLVVEVWYPAEQDADVTSQQRSQRGNWYDLNVAGTTVARLRSPINAQRNVDVSHDNGPLPVVLLSHGAGSSRLGHVGLAEVLASNGYIVAAPDHVGHTMADNVFGISDEARAQSAYDRPLDLSRVLDELERRSHQRSLFRGLVDMSRVAVAGHSFGGRAALGIVGARFDPLRQKRECDVDSHDRRCLALPVFGLQPYRYRDQRIKAALLIAPAGYDFYRADGIARVDAPTLIVGAERDQTTPFAKFHRPVFNALRSPHYMLDLNDAGHLTATDICQVVDSIGFMAKAVGGAQARDGCGEDFMSSRDALEMVSEAALPFLDLYLNGHQAAAEQLRVALAPTPSRSKVASLTAKPNTRTSAPSVH
jgi:predicted dienelactone hydrolase